MKYTRLVALLALLAGFGVVHGQEEDPFTTLVDAEKTFAKVSGEHGIRTAFLQYLSEDAILFRPGPVKGRRYFMEKETVEGSLAWTPTYAEVSAGGDLGFTTGPFEYKGPDRDMSGHYVSVWRKGSNGAWQVILDLGITQSQRIPIEPGEVAGPPAAATAAPGGRRMPTDALRAILLDSEAYVGRGASEQGLLAGLEAQAAADIRLYRDGEAPIEGIEKVRSYLKGERERTIYTLERAEMSAGGDLGYAWGTAMLDRDLDGQPQRAAWARIWRFRGDTGWRVVLDALVPLPAE